MQLKGAYACMPRLRRPVANRGIQALQPGAGKACAIVNREVLRPIRLLGNQAMASILVRAEVAAYSYDRLGPVTARGLRRLTALCAVVSDV